MNKIVIALGGNALGKTPIEQLELVKNTAKQIVEIVKEGNEVVIAHGNGPQVGIINLAFDLGSASGSVCSMPFAECGAMSQGYIGYHLQQAISEELKNNNIDKNCATIITQVLVDKMIMPSLIQLNQSECSTAKKLQKSKKKKKDLHL